ncbi:carboxymuconolactone decarboxylase family protein [Gordonia phthalatica]|uniref:4-carboxymuconolactone decarboxylase n=1 Tax=Gordonia phthalatica TaxID=1136941 RepID=A0A0N9MSD3_9ACTN|nr:carboxymuconolactone decarboxylase family protein [Gordonia phthalatica]ALG85992.1 4-carboxymuconolactone decarboxylase [Gordonia phthalatica]
MTSEAYDAGLSIRREVMGDPFVDRALERTAGTHAEVLQQHITEHAWHGVWSREGLTRRERSLITIAFLTSLRAHEELVGHVRGGMTNGLTPEEITEVMVQAVAYCGAPAALSAMKVAQQVFDDAAG